MLEHETIDGAEAARLIDEANGEPVHPVGTKTVSALSAKSRRRGEGAGERAGQRARGDDSRTRDPGRAHAGLAAADATGRLRASAR